MKTPPLDSTRINLGFQLSAAGGIIDLTVKDPSAPLEAEALKRFVDQLREGFGRNDFSGLGAILPKSQRDFEQLSRTSGLARSISPIPSGYRISFGASDQASRTAIHNLIRNARGNPALSVEERAMNHPGNNLGWDTKRDANLER